MATFKPTINTTVRPWGTERRMYMLENIVDFAASSISAVQNDIVEALAVPAKTLVLAAGMKVITTEADATDIDLGITGVSADGFVDGASFATAGLKVDLDEAFADGAYLDAADTIDIKITGNHTVNQAKVKVWALCVDLSEL